MIKLQQHIHEKLAAKQTIFVACSGGSDSMALIHVLLESGFQPHVLHVNFQLRGKESDADEAFVAQHCDTWGLPFQSKKVNTLDYIEKYGGAIQLAARTLRYEWFDELIATHPNAICCTAHHQGDNIEQLVLKAISSGSLLELSGIPEERGVYLRPLLHVSKLELLKYLEALQIPWREDASNAKNEYTRNKIRNQVLPLLCEIDKRSEAALVNLQHEVNELKHELQTHINELIASQPNSKAFLVSFSVWDKQLTLWKSLFIQTLTHAHLKQHELAKLRAATNGAKMSCGAWTILKQKEGLFFEEKVD